MPGIELMDYTRGDFITGDIRDEITEMVHDVLEKYNGKRPGHSNFKYSPAGHLDTSGYNYILVVDGETTEKTQEFQDTIRIAIKHKAAQIMNIDPDTIAVRYRLNNASFG